MITFFVRMKFREEDRKGIEEVLIPLAEASRQEPGCLAYTPHWMESEPDTLLLYEQYRDEAALEHHRASEHFKQYAVGGLYQKMLDRQLENLHALL
ncbi:MAG: putative quinol monooxygenase [Acidobacteriaceae bacterium]|nr:putative quinol monooxygenase [Acidobacteriaceae bacterium]